MAVNYSIIQPLHTYNFTNCEIDPKGEGPVRVLIHSWNLFSLDSAEVGGQRAACCSSLHKGDSKSRDDLIRALRYCATERKGGREEEERRGKCTWKLHRRRDKQAAVLPLHM